jgi:glycerophosphoryl diester phosphodiesterase
VKPERTLQTLYLDPLRERVKRHGGRVFPNGPEFTLLIDIKTDWKTTYPVLRVTLTNYADMLSTFRDGAKQTNAITVIISGSRAKEMFAGETVRFAAYDGTLADLDLSAPADLIPWISGSWAQSFDWRGQGEIPEAEAARLKSIVTKAHAQGRRVRFWGAPDNAGFWRTMRDAGVDLINTDDLAGLEDFLHRH